MIDHFADINLTHYFARPALLPLLVLLLPIAALLRREQRLRMGDWALLAPKALVGATNQRRIIRRRRWHLLRVTGIGALILIALAGPQAYRQSPATTADGGDVIIVLDVSRSMSARDVFPTRWFVAQTAATAWVNALGRESATQRVGIILFAGRGVVRAPLTTNLGMIKNVIAQARTNEVTPAGSNLAAAIEAAVQLGESADAAHPASDNLSQSRRSIVIFSDGEDLAGRGADDAVITLLRERGIAVHAAAIGDAEHAHPMLDESTGEPRTFRGTIAKTQRSDAALQAITQAAGGQLFTIGPVTAATPATVQRLVTAWYRDSIAPRERLQRDLSPAPRSLATVNIAAWFLLPCIGIALLWPTAMSLHLLPVARNRKNVGAGLAVLFALPLIGASQTDGIALYAKGDFAAAWTAFEADIRAHPQESVPRYNAAAALYRLGRYDAAADRYREALLIAQDQGSPLLAAKSRYALGNCAAALRDWENARTQYQAGLEILQSLAKSDSDEDIRRLRPLIADAENNLAWVKTRIAEAEAASKPQPQKPEDERANPRPGRTTGEPKPPENPNDPDAKTTSVNNADDRQVQGGAGGTGVDPQLRSPLEQLNDALAHIRKSLDQRLPDQPGENAQSPADAETPDW